jgi:hypothetical protein
MKKSLLIILTIISLITLPMLTYGDSTVASTVDSKAEALNKLTLLQGDGINFNLNGQLKRSEAIAFIVRIMGKEALVNANKDKYKITSFKDVKSTDWFAAYVGFCQEQKLLSGFPDGGFHPNDSISEKAFLRLVLGAFGFLDQTDYIWDTIYASAYNWGLVTDAKYKVIDMVNETTEESTTQSTDNTKYLRSDVVNVLYNALTKPMKGTKKTIAENLIDANVFDRATAVSLGLVKEVISAKITNVVVANDVALTVTLSNSVKPLLDQNILIYETANKANTLKASVTSQVYGNLLITTSTQIPEKDYTIEITNTVEDSNTPAVATSTFKGYKIVELKSDYFKISKVVPISKNRINVYFTQPITDEIALPIYYEIMKSDASFVKGSRNTLDVKVLSEQNNVVSLYLKNAAIADDVPYSLKISGDLISAYGVQLNDGLGDSIAFASKAQDNEALKVDRIYTVDSKTVRVEFNKEVDSSNAIQLGNYQISTSNGIPNAFTKASLSLDGKGKALLLTAAIPFDRTVTYQVIINNMTDVFKVDSLNETSYPFNGKPLTELKDLKIILVTALDKSTIQINFDKKIDKAMAFNNGYFTLNGMTDPNFVTFPSKIYVNPTNSSSIKIYLPSGKELVSTSIYKLKVLNLVTDELGNTSTADTTFTFTGSSNVIVKPLITEALVIGKDTIKIKSSKELSLSGANVSLSNYSLELKEGKNTVTLKTPSSIIAYDESTIILHFDGLDTAKNYTFKYDTLTDYSGLNVRGSADGSTSLLLKNGVTP